MKEKFVLVDLFQLKNFLVKLQFITQICHGWLIYVPWIKINIFPLMRKNIIYKQKSISNADKVEKITERSLIS